MESKLQSQDQAHQSMAVFKAEIEVLTVIQTMMVTI
jgi:hypothetical protein